MRIHGFMGLLVVVAVLGLALPAGAAVNIPVIEFIVHFFGDPLSVVIAPDGSGRPLSQAYAYGGVIEDGTISLRVISVETGDPIWNYPNEDVWLLVGQGSQGTVTGCNNGVFNPDDPSDSDGRMWFSEPLRGGGWSIQGGVFYLNGEPARDPQGALFPVLEYQINSPDINGDLVVDITDIALFVQGLGNYHYRFDYNFDGFVGLSDIALFTQSLGSECD